MEATEVQALVENKVKDAVQANNTELLRNIGDMINKISSPHPSTVVQNETPIFKRKSNHEQFKYNAKVISKLEEAENRLTSQSINDAKQSIIEAKELVKRRQKLIQLADTSELGWRMVAEYETNPIASDSEDERRIYKAEARASRKVKGDKAKKRSLRPTPSSKPGSRPDFQNRYTQLSVGQQQRPGLCFVCGKQGHWKNECPQRDRNANNKISNSLVTNIQSEGHELGNKVKGSIDDEIHYEDSGTQFEGRKEEADKGESILSPVGRLKKEVSNWKGITESVYILDVIENGYKLPLKEIPPEAFLRNNKSARENPQFVSKEIQSLLRKGIISEVSSKPTVINPLKVAYSKVGKARLVLDCRHINPCLHLFKVKFEDIIIALDLFDLSNFVFTFDLKSAYHHIDIYPDHCTYLGFSWNEGSSSSYYVYNSLPFGIATAGHIFTKVLRYVVKHCRVKGHRVIMFLDDGIGGQVLYEKAQISSNFIRQTILRLGFLLAEDKCNWIPMRTAVWLGYVFDFDQNKLFVKDEPICRLVSAIQSLLLQIKADHSMLVPVRFLASVTGQIILLQSVIGKLVCRKTRYLHRCIDSRWGWNCVVAVGRPALAELQFWFDNVCELNSKGRALEQYFKSALAVFSDASAVGYGGYISAVKQSDEIELPNESLKVRKAKDCFNVTLPEVSFNDCKQRFSDVEKINPGGSIVKLPEVSLRESKLEFTISNQSGADGSTLKLPEVSYNEDGVSETNHVSSEGSVFKLPEASLGDVKLGFPEVSQAVSVDSVRNGVSQLPEASCFISELPEVSQRVAEVKDCLNTEGYFIGVGLRDSIKRKIDEAGIPITDDLMVVKRMATHILSSRAEGTVSKYYYQVQTFKEYCVERGFPSAPAFAIHVAIYLSHMIDIGKSDNVITGAFYAIKWLHQINDLPDPTDNSFVKNVLECVKRHNSKPVVKKEVISSENLIELCDGFADTSDVIVTRDLTMILLSFAGFLRFSEVSDLRCCDIVFNTDYLVLKVRKSKTDIYRSGKEVLISKGISTACPYTMLQRYLSCASLDVGSDNYLFQPACRSGQKCFLLNKNKKLSYTRARECILSKLKLVVPNLRLGTHSLRASGATVAANAVGVSDRCLKRHGRWKTDTAKDGYIEDSIEKRLFITKQLKL